MKLDRIKKQLEDLENENGERKDYSKIFWSPDFGKHTIRIVPSKFDPDFPFTELEFHYNIAKFPMIALTNFGEQDPIVEFAKELRKTDDKDNWSLAGKLNPKTRFFAPVVVRGEEDKGVRLWSFGVNIYKALLKLAEDEDIGDYTDVIQGWDLVVDKVKGNPYPETTVRIKPKQSPLSNDPKKVDLWLNDQPDPMDSFTKFDFAYIKKQLLTYLYPDATEKPESASTESDTETESAVEKPKATKTSVGTVVSTTKPTATSPADEFDELFDN